MMIEEMGIKDWIESDQARSLESTEDYAKWNLFEIVDSDKRLERYPLKESGGRTYVGVNNEVAVGNYTYAVVVVDNLDVDKLKEEIGKVLISLRNVAIAKKLEGWAVGTGKLMIQSRTNIRIEEDRDFDPGRYRAVWRGIVDRVSEDCDLDSPLPHVRPGC